MAQRDRPPSLAQLSAELLVGEYPREIDVEWLKREHRVTAVHNLQDDEDFKNYGVDLENFGVPPDVWVKNSPNEDAKGVDHELKVAIEEALKMLKSGSKVATTSGK